ncbi:MAG: hypothetical protein QHH07_12550, partial [Sedimentisphaerales bacterium]|nr:hypothetical protein [Sedimentisphaerales bacterium]
MKGCLLVLLMVVGLGGCAKEPQQPLAGQLKITDLAPRDPNGGLTILDTTNLDVYVFHVQADRLADLRGLWDGLNIRPIRFANYTVFRANAFRVAQATVQRWDWILGSLAEAQARLANITTVWLDGDQPHDMKVWALPKAVRVTYTSQQGSQETAMVGPGVLALRLKAEAMGSRGAIRQLVAYPVSTPGVVGHVDRLVEFARRMEVPFMGAAFTVPIREGDIVVLGPEEYCGDQSTLGGLFFRELQPATVVEPGPANVVQKAQVVRVYV